jgi:hypothetical protein
VVDSDRVMLYSYRWVRAKAVRLGPSCMYLYAAINLNLSRGHPISTTVTALSSPAYTARDWTDALLLRLFSYFHIDD